ncbi:helix-turn-helix domain-containing protein [Gramella sp. GC03-9]|uniref:Helix-turn-helix domain-containing protein n=1 Tax=Christiangramia oceanisediminis TaxID=2920386 RepID=A0A9X2KWN0_9FLAO|nr:triple tyrosine motif-containing protein [Gramella oceanisediminis]MCP9199634.1 helix-turn-helix domain-containing protein [Gramella oceanisediminis]
MGHFKFNILFSLSMILGFTGMLTGQDAGTVKRIEAVDAFLRADEVHIQQDSGDDLWITTPVKLLRYNSVEVEHFNKFKGIPREVGEEYLSTYTDSQNNIWLAADKGLAVLEKASEEFKYVSAVTGKVYAMREDSGNQLWIAAENGIFKLKTDASSEDFGISRFLSENTMAADVVLNGNEVVFAGPNGILKIDRRSGKFDKVDMGYFQNLNITSILPLGDQLVFGTRASGLYKLDGDLKRIQKIYSIPYELATKEITSLQALNDELLVSINGGGIIHLNKNLELSGEINQAYPKQIYATYLNDQNLLWMVSKKGLYLSNLAGNAVQNLTHDPAVYSSLANDLVTAGEKDALGNVWFGTSEGLSIWNPETSRWRHIKNLNYSRAMEMPDEITDLAATGEHMWVATANDGVYKINIYTLKRAHYSVDALFKTKIQSARTVYIDPSENVWIGGDDGYLTQVTPKNEIKEFPIKNVQALAELGPQKLIVATRIRVHSLNPSTGRISDLSVLNAGEDLVYYTINDLKITHDGIGLFATEGAGLLLYNFEEESVKQIDRTRGLPSDNISGIYGENSDEIWIATDKGMACYQDSDSEMMVFSEYNGLNTAELTTGFVELPDGSLVIGSTKGVNIFKPKVMLAQQEFTPRLELLQLNLPGEKDPAKRELDILNGNRIKIDENTGFQVSFAGYSHLDPEKILYSWKMEGLDENWREPTNLNTASYSGLAPGSYVFKVRAKLNGSGWSEVQEVPVSVQPVAGAIPTVYVFMGISVISMIAIFAFVFIHRSKNADKMARKELRDQLQKEFKKPVENAVKSLSKISASQEAGENEDLQRFAARFDELFNQILNFSYEESVYEISRIDLHRHFPEILEEIEPVYQLKELEMITNDQWGNNEFFYNKEMLDKIFFSLISGSAGYSFKGGKIIVNLIETSVGDLKLQITDNGRGIPSYDIRELERKKVDESRLNPRDKSGLRYILKARDLIAKAGGSFSFETEKNEGSTFTAILKNRQKDYKKAPERAAAVFMAEKTKKQVTPEVPSELKNLSDAKILVIENDETTRNVLVNNIGRYCQVYQASTVEEGLEKAGMIFPDIIISALVLPDMNAFQFTKMLKRNISLNHINVYLLAEEGELSEEQLAEFSEYLLKPVNVAELLNKLTKTLVWQKELRNSFVKAHLENSQVPFRNESDEKFISELRKLIIANIQNENFSVHDLSANLGMNSNSLFMKLKSLTGLSPQDFMEFVRLEYGRQLLSRGDLNAMEAAYRSGFSSPSIFQGSYKKFFGQELEVTLNNNTE